MSGMPKKSQREKFEEAAREIGAERVSEKRFDAALSKVGKAAPAPMHKGKRRKSRKRD